MIQSRFRSRSEHTLDEKGRLNLPSRFREVLRQYESEMLMIAPWGRLHLRVYPLSGWEILENKLLTEGREEKDIDRFVRYMVGGRTVGLPHERILRFQFPERPGAFLRFLNSLQPAWALTLFHYRNHGDDVGRVLAILRKLDYRGPVGIIAYGIKGDRRDILRRSIEAWRTLAAKAAD